MILKRITYESTGIYGILSNDDGSQIAETLEHAFDDSHGNYAPKLNTGDHICIFGTHQLDHGGPIQTYEITGVPGHSGILFHMGNYNSDSDGCVLLGEAKIGDMITNSDATFKAFISSLQGVQSFILTVE